MKLVAGAVAVVAAAFVLASGAAGFPLATTACGQVTVRLGGNDFSYRIRIVSGTVACATARTVMRVFIARAVTSRGWFCTRGHSSDAWAASCARVPRGAVVRAYLIAG